MAESDVGPGVEWYHAEGGERRGPVDGTTLRRLVAEGVVGDETLVWREGWERWRPLGEVRAEIEASEAEGAGGDGPALARCLHSGEWRPVGEMLRYGDGYVAPEFKDAFVARLERGEDPMVPVGPESLARAGFGELLGGSIRLFASRFGLLMLAYGMIAVPIAGLSNFADYRVLDEESFGASVAFYTVLDVLFGSIAIGAAVAVLGAAVDGRRIGLGDALATGVRWWVPLMLTNLLVTLLAGVGILLLVVPGVLVLVRAAFVMYVVVEEGRWGSDGLARSWRMTRGYGWLIVGSGLLFLLVAVVISAAAAAPTAYPPLDHWLVLTLGQVFVLPVELVMTAFYFLLYRQVRAREGGAGSAGGPSQVVR